MNVTRVIMYYCTYCIQVVFILTTITGMDCNEPYCTLTCQPSLKLERAPSLSWLPCSCCPLWRLLLLQQPYSLSSCTGPRLILLRRLARRRARSATSPLPLTRRRPASHSTNTANTLCPTRAQGATPDTPDSRESVLHSSYTIRRLKAPPPSRLGRWEFAQAARRVA